MQSTLTDLQAASTALGIQTILSRNDLTKYYRDPATDSRTPDFFVVSQKGVIYTGGLNGVQVGNPVFTTQIAPTILSVFGISPDELQAVRIEGTRALPPGLTGDAGDTDHRLDGERENPSDKATERRVRGS